MSALVLPRAGCTIRRVLVGLDEGVLVEELPRLVVHLVDIGLKLRPFDSPLTASADLDGLEFPVADERIRLGRLDIQHVRHVSQGQKAFRAHAPPSAGFARRVRLTQTVSQPASALAWLSTLQPSGFV